MNLEEKKILTDKNSTYLERITTMLEYVEEQDYDSNFLNSMGAIEYVIEIINKQVELNKKSNNELEMYIINKDIEFSVKDQAYKILSSRKRAASCDLEQDSYSSKLNAKKNKNDLIHLINKYDKVGYYEQINSSRYIIQSKQLADDYDYCLEHANKIKNIISSQSLLVKMSFNELEYILENTFYTIQERNFIYCLVHYEQLNLFDSGKVKQYTN